MITKLGKNINDDIDDRSLSHLYGLTLEQISWSVSLRLYSNLNSKLQLQLKDYFSYIISYDLICDKLYNRNNK